MTDLFCFNIFATAVVALCIRGFWSIVQRRTKAALSVWMMALVWTVFWYGFDEIAVASQPKPPRSIYVQGP